MTNLIKLDDFNKALARLETALLEAHSELDRDGTIQRFEFTFELAWKVIQEFVRYKGLETASPRDAFRLGADLKIIDNPEIWFEFLKDRNTSTRLYDEGEAEKIFSRLPMFAAEAKKLLENIRFQLQQDLV